MFERTFHPGGIHPAPSKLTAGMPIVAAELPRRAIFPLSQHIGAPATPCVAPGTRVSRGQLIATAAGPVSANVHSSISGTVTAIGPVEGPAGYPVQAIVVEATEADHEADTRARDRRAEIDTRAADRSLSERHTPDEIRDRIASAGIVGMGGATFPTAAKIGNLPGRRTDTLIINACECEPYLTCDDALCRAHAPRIAEGIELMLIATGATRAIIGIEDNKPEAIDALRRAIDGSERISLMVLRTRYPQGGEKQLVEAVTGRRVPSGSLPCDVGAVVQNVATAYAVYAAVETGTPLIERIVTVTGDIPSGRGNYAVATGTPLSQLLPELPGDCQVILGGPMMGRSAVCLDAPVTKGTSGIVVLAPAHRRTVEPCIRCGACVEACPMGLEPYLLATYGRLRMWDDAAARHIADCIDCGSCSYSCPSSRPIVDFIRVAKAAIKNKSK